MRRRLIAPTAAAFAFTLSLLLPLGLGATADLPASLSDKDSGR